MQIRRRVANYLCGTDAEELAKECTQRINNAIPVKRKRMFEIEELETLEFWATRMLPNLVTLGSIACGNLKGIMLSEVTRHYGSKAIRWWTEKTATRYEQMYGPLNRNELPAPQYPGTSFSKKS